MPKRPPDETLPVELIEKFEHDYSLDHASSSRIENGDEALVWRVQSRSGELVVHISPEWRTQEELQWVHDVIAFVSDEVREAIPPLRAASGVTSVSTAPGLMTVYPLVHGVALDKTDDAQVRGAGELLARIHRRLLAYDGSTRPSPSEDSPRPRETPDEPTHFTDRDLDVWWTKAQDGPWTKGILHGDYYRRNLLCRNGTIVGVVDWHEARSGVLASELAFAAWEMAHDDEMSFLPDRASVFVDAYRAAGPLQGPEYEALVPLMRLALRENARYGIDAARLGGLEDHEYILSQASAFVALRDAKLA